MSSSNDDIEETSPKQSLPGAKKRRILRACDICRRKKIRCDSTGIPGEKCTNCLAFNSECTHAEPAKKRGPKGHIDVLQQRVTKMESLIQKLRPGADINEELEHADDLEGPLGAVASSSVRRSPPTMVDLAMFNRGQLNDEELTHIELIRNMQNLTIDCDQDRFFGQSSGFMFARKALDVKKEYTNEADGPLARTEVWRMHPWELAQREDPPPDYDFPEDDLLADLVVVYFEQVNTFIPVLHRPTFERYLAEDLHYTNPHFGALVLVMCAVAARYSDDPRTILEGTNSKHSSGWRWFSQVEFMRKNLYRTASLFELQFYCLSAYYTQGTSAPQAVWAIIGMGIRFAQEKGVHRRKRSDHHWTIDDELWKRAFWVLLSLDRMICSFLGRPCSVHDEDYDLELPIECDDEYWEHPDPEKAWQQPPGKPSYVSYFNALLKLYDILGFTLRTIYSVNKFKASLGEASHQWESEVVLKLDSALNRWVDLVPDHLRWDPNRQDNLSFYQSAALYVTYYYIQIQIHRPFIPTFGGSSSLSFPSLAICANAARSCSHVLHVQYTRGPAATPQIEMATFCAGIVLLMNIWGGKKSGLSTDPAKEMADAHKCMQHLKWAEHRWHIAARFLDILCHIASIGDLPLPHNSPHPKRDRESTDLPDSPSSSSNLSGNEEARPIVGNSRVRGVSSNGSRSSSLHHSTSTHFSPPAQQQPPQQSQSSIHPSNSITQPAPYNRPSNLPIYSDQLGSLPVHGQIDFSQFPPPEYTQWNGVGGVGADYSRNDVPPSTSSGNMQPLEPDMGAGQIPQAGAAPVQSFSAPSHSYTDQDYVFHSSLVATFSGQPGHQPNTYDVTGSNGVSHSAVPHDGGGHSSSLLPRGQQPQQQRRHQHQHQPHPQQQQQQHAQYASTGPAPTEAVNMWSNAPVGFSLEDWGSFIDNSGIHQQQHSY